MDWSASSEIIETLDSTINPSSVAHHRLHHDARFLPLPRSADVDLLDLVDGVVSAVFDAGEKLYASMLQWTPWKSDLKAPPESVELDRFGVDTRLEEKRHSECGREIQLTQCDPSLEKTQT